MNSKWLIRTLQVTVVALTLAAVFQELEKPKEERKWCGKVAGIFPYDFRIPTIQRLKESYWNPYESRVFTPPVFGLGQIVPQAVWSHMSFGLKEHLLFSRPNFLENYNL